MMVEEFRHTSVMPSEVLDLLDPKSGGIYLDGTLGGAGHARLILERSSPDGILVGLDRDPEALAAATKVLAPFQERVILRQENYSAAQNVLDELGFDGFDGMLLDLGVSSRQLDSFSRGFSFREDGPLDMRMGPDAPQTAADVLNSADEYELKRIFRDYGEERWSGKIAKRVVATRLETPLETTLQFAELVRDTVPKGRVPSRIHPATRVFQALRIFVNDELGSLQSILSEMIELLKPGGRFVVISFHSLEDRLVKRAFRKEVKGCQCPPRAPVCFCGQLPRAEMLIRKGLKATEEEVAGNPRARSAIVRAIRRLP
jgi:16S rRNA (cytosine1402-N4)-methyltransferase